MRRAGEDQFHRIENTGDVSFLLEIEAVGIGPAHGIAVRADADHDFVAAGLERRLGVEITGRETGHVVAEQGPVEEDARAEHRLGNFQGCHGGKRAVERKRPPIPERIAFRVLLRNAFALGDLGPRRVESRHGQRDQARHGHAAVEIRRGRIHLPLGDLPRAVERDDDPLGSYLSRYREERRPIRGPGGGARTEHHYHEIQREFLHRRVSFCLDGLFAFPASMRTMPASCNDRGRHFDIRNGHKAGYFSWSGRIRRKCLSLQRFSAVEAFRAVHHGVVRNRGQRFSPRFPPACPRWGILARICPK